MRKILLTTTALIALGSVSAVAADVSLSGNVRFRYQAWSDDVAAAGGTNNSSMVDLAFIYLKTSETTDNGLALSTRTRFREGGGMDLNMISIGGDFGTVTFGNQWNLSPEAAVRSFDSYSCRWWLCPGRRWYTNGKHVWYWLPF